MLSASLPFIDYLVVLVYLFLMLGIGFYFTRFMKGGKEFFIGGNLIPWWVAGISLYMTTFSAWMFTGAASFTYNTGWYGLLFFAVKPIGFFIGFQVSAWRWRRTRVTSPVEYVRTRFNRSTHLFLSIMLSISMIYWPGHHLASLSKICAPALFPNSMLAVDVMIVVSGLLILMYTVSGGLWAVCLTDVVQFLILFCICLVLIPAVFGSGEIGTLSQFVHHIPELKLHHVIREKTVYNEWYLVGFLAAGIFGNAVGDKAQRYYSVRDEKAARRVGWLAFALFLTGPILFGIPPLVGKFLWPSMEQLPYFGHISKPDETIFIAVVMHFLPAGMVGMFLSAMMAASMSALDSVWNTVSSVVSLDIYKTLFRPHASEKEVLLVGRITVVVMCLIAITMALLIIHSEYGIFTLSNIVLGLIGIPVTIPLLIGIVSKNISRWSAISSILAGILTAAVTRFGLNFTLGTQYLVTIAVTLLFIYLSIPLGKLFLHSRTFTLLVGFLVGTAFWGVVAIVDGKTGAGNAGWWWLVHTGFTYDFFQSHILLLIVSLGYAGLVLISAALYARDIGSDQEDVEQFFQKLATPIDVNREIIARGVQEKHLFYLVGLIAMGLAMLSLLLLLAPEGRSHFQINLIFAVLLFFIGAGMFFSKKRGNGQIPNGRKF